MVTVASEMGERKSRGHLGDTTQLLPEAVRVCRIFSRWEEEIANGSPFFKIKKPGITHSCPFCILKAGKKFDLRPFPSKVTNVRENVNDSDLQFHAGETVPASPCPLGKDN